MMNKTFSSTYTRFNIYNVVHNVSYKVQTFIIGGGTEEVLGALAHTKFTNVHRNLVFTIEMCLVT